MSDDLIPFPPGLEALVADTKFIWPGWMIYLGRDNEGTGAPVLHIVSCTPNSYAPEQTIRVNHSFLIPLATYNERTWRAWIKDCYDKVFSHEVGEMLLFGGVRMFGPHHGDGEDPYRIVQVDGGDLADTKVRSGETREEYDRRVSTEG